MSDYPIVFGLRDVIQGEGFLARVAVDGRALVHEEEDAVWIEGVNPGGFSETGASVTEAIERFRRSYTAILFDVAADAETFEGFRDEVNRFFNDSSPGVVREWEQAVEDVREGRISANWLSRTSAADAPLRVCVEEIRHPSSRNNEVEAGPALAA